MDRLEGFGKVPLGKKLLLGLMKHITQPHLIKRDKTVVKDTMKDLDTGATPSDCV